MSIDDDWYEGMMIIVVKQVPNLVHITGLWPFRRK
jgi:hypothetical protein